MKNEMMQQESIGAMLSASVQSGQELNRKLLLKQLSSLRYLLRQGLAIRGHADYDGNLVLLLMLRSDDCNGLNSWLQNKKYVT